MSETEEILRTQEFTELKQSLWSQVKSFEDKYDCRIIIVDFDFVQVVNIRKDGQ